MTDAGWPGYLRQRWALRPGPRCWSQCLGPIWGWTRFPAPTYMRAFLSCSPQGMAFTLEEAAAWDPAASSPCFLSQDVQLLRVARY